MCNPFGCFLAMFLGAYSFIQNTAGTSPEDLVKRAQSGDAIAQFELGRAYEDGKGFPQDEDSAVMWFRKAAEQGNAKAQSSLGAMYAVGRGVSKDNAEAVRWYKKAAKQGLPEGMYNVAISYFNGEGVPADLNSSYAWMLAAQGNGDTQAEEALKHISDEMSGRIEQAKFKLGEMYERGEEIPKDLASAATIYLEIAHKDYPRSQFAPAAKFKMCQMYALGAGVPLDLGEAKSWCKKAGEPPRGSGAPVFQNALLMLGRIAEQEKNTAEAEGWYEKAILARDGRGFLPLAKLKMQDGPAGERDAYFWLYLAKEFNVAGSDVQLQQVAARVTPADISKEEKKARQWLEKHAPQKVKIMKQP